MGARRSKAVREELERRRKEKRKEGAGRPMVKRFRWHAIVERIASDERTVGVEVGVLRGNTAQRVLNDRPLCTHIMVDPWAAPPEDSRWAQSPGLTQHRDQKFFDECYWLVSNMAKRYGDRAVIIRDYSLNAAKKFNESAFDYVFIDAEHTYEGVMEDVTAWLPKVKRGGWIGGHDYSNGHFTGVKRAVDELFQRDVIELDVDHTWFVKV